MKTYRFFVELKNGNELYAYEKGCNVQDAEAKIWKRFPADDNNGYYATAVTYRQCPRLKHQEADNS